MSTLKQLKESFKYSLSIVDLTVLIVTLTWRNSYNIWML